MVNHSIMFYLCVFIHVVNQQFRVSVCAKIGALYTYIHTLCAARAHAQADFCTCVRENTT